MEKRKASRVKIIFGENVNVTYEKTNPPISLFL